MEQSLRAKVAISKGLAFPSTKKPPMSKLKCRIVRDITVKPR
jgi:hypothetical protein